MEIQALRTQGWSISAIARHLGVDRKTVRAHLAGERVAGVRRRSGADPFEEVEDYVRQRLADDAHVRATVLFAEVVALGYGQSHPTFVRRIRHRGLRGECPACSPLRAHVDIEHPAGEEIQWDWLELRDTPWGAKAFVLVGVLPYSGRLRCWFSEAMDQAHLVAGIHQVLVRLGGTARRWRTDRMAAVVAPGTDRIQASFAPVAKHYGAAVDVCPPRRPMRKGAVEKSIDYLTQSWWRTAPVASPEAAQASADRWCAEVADMRPRRVGDTIMTVAEAAEREALLVLPAAAFPATLTLNRSVSANALVAVWGYRYSVPPELAAGLCGSGGVASATAVPAPGVGVAAHDAVAIDAGSRTGDAAGRVGSQAQDPATTRARAATARLAVRGPATMTQAGAAPADPAAASNAVTDPHNGGIDRPRIAWGCDVVAFSAGLARRQTGVVSISNRSLGVHSNAVHNAASVVSLTCAGCLVSNADTDAADIDNPALSASSRRSSAPVHTSRCAAAMRSFHCTFTTRPPRSTLPASPMSLVDTRPR